MPVVCRLDDALENTWGLAFIFYFLYSKATMAHCLCHFMGELECL